MNLIQTSNYWLKALALLVILGCNHLCQFQVFGDDAQNFVRYYSPGASGNGLSSNTPANFDTKTLRQQLNGEAGSNKLVSGQTNVTLVFLPGTHTNVIIRSRFGSLQTLMSNYVFRIVGTGGRPEDTVLRFASGYNDGYGDSGYNTVAPIVLGFHHQYDWQLYQMVVSNLTVDCNWKEQPVVNSPAYCRTYKLAAIYGNARYGHISKVICKNGGAHGMVPGSIYDNGAGVEAFPILCYGIDFGQEPLPGFPRPWLIEDVEMHGFNTVYDGYGTMLSVMGTKSKNSAVPGVLTPEDIYRDATRRFSLIRGCQIRGGTIGFGLNGSDSGGSWGVSGATYSGNVLLNQELAHQSDTGEVHALDHTNNVSLDVSVVLNHGTWFSSAI